MAKYKAYKAHEIWCGLVVVLLVAFLSFSADAECRGGDVPGSVEECTPDTAPPCHGRECDGDVDIPVDPLLGQSAQFNSILADMRRYSEAARAFTALNSYGSSENLAAAISQAYAAIYPEYGRIYDEGELYTQQVSFFRRERDKTLQDINDRQNTLSERTAQLNALLEENKKYEEDIAANDATRAELEQKALGLLNDPRSGDVIISMLLVFAPDPHVTADRLGAAPVVVSLPGMQGMPMEPWPNVNIPFWNDGPKVPWPTEMPDRPLSVLSAESTVPQKLASLTQIKDGLAEATDILEHMKPEAEALKAEFEPLWDRKVSLGNQSFDAGEKVDDAKNSNNFLKEKYEAVDENKATAAKALMGAVAVSYAQDLAKDKLHSLIDDIAGSSGVADSIPTGGDEVFMQLAKEGRRILLPQNGYEKQWESFVSIQQQSLHLLDRAEGYMAEAAHLCAQGTPEQMQGLLEKVFADVKWQTVEYVRTVGNSVNAEEDKSLFEKAFDKYLDARKLQAMDE